MSLLTKIKYFLASRSYEKALAVSVRQPVAVRLQNAESIGILFDANDSEFSKHVIGMGKKLRDEYKKVVLLGFMDAKLEEDLPHSKLDLDYFGSFSLDYQLKSKSFSAQNFIGEPFDLLIDLNMGNSLILKRIAMESMAKFKVGISSDDTRHLDLWFEIPPPAYSEESIPDQSEIDIQRSSALYLNIKKYLTTI